MTEIFALTGKGFQPETPSAAESLLAATVTWPRPYSTVRPSRHDGSRHVPGDSDIVLAKGRAMKAPQFLFFSLSSLSL